MSDQPIVCCILLVNGRREMTRRAIASFRAQTYDLVSRWLILFDSGLEQFRMSESDLENEVHVDARAFEGSTIGALRNAVNSLSRDGRADLIAHFDSDDVSHPRRLEEQVALLQASGKQCVGYRECLFWDTRRRLPGGGYRYDEAWLYRQDDPRFAIGASFMYRRELWEKHPFPDAPHEDYRWWLTPEVSNNCMGVSSVVPREVWRDSSEPQAWQTQIDDCGEPRMICQIHGANTEQIPREVMLAGDVWRRASEFDVFCTRVMNL